MLGGSPRVLTAGVAACPGLASQEDFKHFSRKLTQQFRRDRMESSEPLDVEVLTNTDSSCKATDDDLLQTHPALGFSDDVLWVDSTEGWKAVADTWYEDGRTHFEWDLDD